ncbi:multidrug resistance-associated protein 14 [Actinidia rufa]|uniref:Multidrug resistance-associated protein 14 n=1 Tax=Actinidia rufa TaxID=165716 RepID=A0A7J0E7D7_9ERIC|nr:multidrug resistance-associated protein 14 [Actinidia rufa]
MISVICSGFAKIWGFVGLYGWVEDFVGWVLVLNLKYESPYFELERERDVDIIGKGEEALAANCGITSQIINLLISDGEILHAAPYHHLLDSSREFQDLVNAHKETAGTEKVAEVSSSQKHPISAKEIRKTRIENNSKTSGGDKLIKQEEREVGDTGFRPYVQYLNQNRGYLFLSMASLCHLAFQIGQILQNTWMAASVENPRVSTLRLIIVYLVIGFSSMVFLLGRSLCTVALGMESSKSLFSQLLNSLFRAPMSFYDSTPLGRILSRMSSDLSIVDLDVPFNFILSIGATINAYSNLIVLAVVTWQVLFVSIPMIYLAILLQRLEILCAIVLSSSALCMVLLPPGTFNPGFIGMALSYGLSLNITLVFSIQNQCTLANYIISVERLNQYMHITSEAPEVIEENHPPVNWPILGKVEIHNLQWEDYSDRCFIPSSGAFKGKHCSRWNQHINDWTSQDPTLFNGTVRYNLDPLSQHIDQEIWEVLGKCQLGEAVQEKEEGLDSLGNSRRWFKLEHGTEAIVLFGPCPFEEKKQDTGALAHRIPTVMDCTMVLAISDGKMVEYDEPLKLMKKEDSLFGQLVKEYWSHYHSAESH